MTSGLLAAHTDELIGRLESLAGGVSSDERRRLVSVTVELEARIDPSAIAFASRLAGERWFCWEQPARGLAIATLGAAQSMQHTAILRQHDIGGS